MSREVVYIIGPEEDPVTILRGRLEGRGYSVQLFRNAGQGLDKAKTLQPDLILLEPNLPDKDGLRLLRDLTRDPRTADIPVIMYARRAEPGDVIEGLTQGAEDYIRKDENVEIVVGRIMRALRSKIDAGEGFPGGAMRVRPKFAARDFSPQDDLCFVLMPFTAKWSQRVWRRVSATVEATGYSCERAKELKDDDILEEIWRKIVSAGVIIADVTGRNPNVMYEIGVAHTVGKPVILMTQSVEDIVFDLSGKRHLIYEDNDDGYDDIARDLPDYLRKRTKRSPTGS